MVAKKKKTSCEFCSTIHKQADHELCPVVIQNADGHGGPWYCYCAELRPELHPRIAG